jgi:hypothetical protein
VHPERESIVERALDGAGEDSSGRKQSHVRALAEPEPSELQRRQCDLVEDALDRGWAGETEVEIEASEGTDRTGIKPEIEFPIKLPAESGLGALAGLEPTAEAAPVILEEDTLLVVAQL